MENGRRAGGGDRQAALEVLIVRADDRLDAIAAGIVEHWEGRRANLLGKAMIVCMSRRICVELYQRIAPTGMTPTRLAAR